MMHARQAPAAALPDQVNEPELHIEIWRDWYADFKGTAAQLIAEGLTPEGFEWPHAANNAQWEANGFTYWLRRVRPDGHKGPKRSWLELDHWLIHVQVTGRDFAWRRRRKLERMAEELAAEQYRDTAAGSRERDAHWKRYWKACGDEAFQAFKSLIPGLVSPKRGRKTRSVTQGESHG